MISLLRGTVTILSKSPTLKDYTALQAIIVNLFHNNPQALCKEHKKKKDQNEKKEVTLHSFSVVDQKEKNTFLDVIRLYTREHTAQRGQAEFIMAALKYMDEFGVNKDLEVYKALLDVFPKGKYIPTNTYQIMFKHYPKQQDVALELLNKMEDNRVIPDREMEDMLRNIFGSHSIPIKKYWRMMFWLPKFFKLNPWPLPESALTDPKEISRFAVKKLSDIDVQSEITDYQTKDIQDSIDDTWIVSVMSTSQQELLEVQPTDKPLYIEGPFNIWIANHCIDYFVLKGEPIKRDIVYVDADDVSDLKLPFWDKKEYSIPVTIHEQEDGVYYAMCATGTSTKDSLLSWIRCLQKTNPVLEKIPIIFKLKSTVAESLYIESNERKSLAEDNSECTKVSREGE